jgi:deoxyribodipyrimidine photo-lyase
MARYLPPMTQTHFPPTRTAALERLSSFVPRAGRYGLRRNYDVAGHEGVSQISPYIRHRLITEEEVLRTVLGRYSAQSLEKFVQEVYWRTYWKGWLEMRAPVWGMYKQGLNAALNNVQTQSGLRAEWEAACAGTTGIDCFDHWAKELAETGYLHNHARMWFASIWIFTLRLPWELGADFFMRHLLDGDAASNTCSWRWVGGLQTVGKTYLARPDNITKYTEGRFRPTGLAPHAEPLTGFANPDRQPIKTPDAPQAGARTLIVIHEDDMALSTVLNATPGCEIIGAAALACHDARTPLNVAENVRVFTEGGLQDTGERFADKLGMTPEILDVDALAQVAADLECDQVAANYAPVGPANDTLKKLDKALKGKGIALTQEMPDYDAQAWPYATAGFFKFKTNIPKLIAGLD